MPAFIPQNQWGNDAVGSPSTLTYRRWPGLVCWFSDNDLAWLLVFLPVGEVTPWIIINFLFGEATSLTMINLPTKLYSFGLFRTILDYELNIYQPNLYFSLHWIWIISHIMFIHLILEMNLYITSTKYFLAPLLLLNELPIICFSHNWTFHINFGLSTHFQ